MELPKLVKILKHFQHCRDEFTTKFQLMVRIDPITNPTDKETFLSKFPWHGSVLQAEQRELAEKLLLEFHDIFAKHRFDVGYNTN